MIDAEAVNVYAAGDPEGRIVVALRVDGEWHDYRVQRRDAELFGDVIHLLTTPENVDSCDLCRRRPGWSGYISLPGHEPLPCRCQTPENVEEPT